MSLVDYFKKYVEDNALFQAEQKILVAVSGGVDSMVLLDLLLKAGYECGVAHCNFQLRGEESNEDEELVESVAKEHGVELYNKRFDTVGEMDRTGESMQVVARRLRYDWFEELLQTEGYDIIAIAHHADDSIETFFINMLRGTGLRGLTGISVTRGQVVRPLMFASRKEIVDYASNNDIQYREDSSNRSTKYLRNKLRLGIIPSLKEVNSNFTEIMGDNIQRLTDTQAFIDQAISEIRTRIEKHERGLITINPKEIDSAYPLGYVLYELLSFYGFRGDVVESLCSSLDRGVSGRRFYAQKYVAYINRGNIIIAPIESCDRCEVKVEKDAKRAYFGNVELSIKQVDVDNIDSLNQPEEWVALLDDTLLNFPLIARRWQDGDWFIPLGMEGRKKVSDFLIDEKVSMAEKERQFVLLSGDDIVWLVGRRIDERYKISSGTESVLRIDIVQP